MTISKIINELSKLNYKPSDNGPIWFDDLLYIRVRKGKVKSYTVLRLQSFVFSDENSEYNLADKYDNICTVGRERIYLYKGQNLKIQRVYDIFSHTIIILLIAVLFGITKNFAEIWEYLLG